MFRKIDATFTGWHEMCTIKAAEGDGFCYESLKITHPTKSGYCFLIFFLEVSTMMKLWNDECGAVVSAELVMVMTILGLGMIVGLKSLQAGVGTELGDVAKAIGQVDQTFTYPGIQACEPAMAGVAGSAFSDLQDGCVDTAANPVTVTAPAAGGERGNGN